MKTRLLAVVASTLMASVLVAQSPQLSALGIEVFRQQSMTVTGGGGSTFLRGNVELTVGTATILADEVEYLPATHEAVLRGTVAIRSTPALDVSAKSVNRKTDGLVQFRGDVQIRLGTTGVTVFADGADVRAAENEIKLRGNVVLKKLTPKR
jgi:lipopolysaccharide export system protein LptA